MRLAGAVGADQRHDLRAAWISRSTPERIVRPPRVSCRGRVPRPSAVRSSGGCRDGRAAWWSRLRAVITVVMMVSRSSRVAPTRRLAAPSRPARDSSSHEGSLSSCPWSRRRSAGTKPLYLNELYTGTGNLAHACRFADEVENLLTVHFAHGAALLARQEQSRRPVRWSMRRQAKERVPCSRR